MSITSESYRNVLRHFPSGVTIVTIQAGEERHGLTVSAFTSVSPEPPLIAVMIDQRHHGYEMLEREGASFAVNILAADQDELSNRFAWVKDEDRFAVGNWTTAETGAPVLADALGWLDCRIYDRAPAGTHTIYLGEVVASATPRADEAPLIYWNQGYRHLRLPEHD
jgi:flavin reductase (DIM6/NTAB) family NADH-FMN oxidoreductase RutF